MPTTMHPPPRQTAVAVDPLDADWHGATTGDVDEIPTVRALGADLVAVLVLRGRLHARWCRQAVRALLTAGGRGWRCAAEVALVVLTSCALGWLVWESTEAQRQPAASSAWSVEGRLEGSLGDDAVTADLEAQRSDAPGSASGGTVEDDAPRGTSSGGSPSSSLGGWFLSFAAVAAVLLAGAGAALLVVRRHRRRAEAPAEPLEVRAPGELPDLLPRDEPEEQAGVGEDPLPATEDAGTVIDVVDDGAGGQAVDAATEAPATPSTLSGRTGSTALTVSSGVVSTNLFGGDSAVLVGDAVTSRIETRQRLYERRAAPRVEYVRPGLMAWRGATCEMTVRDLSGTGLRLRVPAPGASSLPSAGDYVQVDFPTDAGQVRVTAQVAWRRTLPEGTELGVVFRPLAAQDEQRIRDTCAART